MDNHDGGTMISGEQNVRNASLLALRSALKLETHGLKRRGRSARQMANDITGKNDRTAVKAYASLNAHIVSILGPEFDRPL